MDRREIINPFVATRSIPRSPPRSCMGFDGHDKTSDVDDDEIDETPIPKKSPVEQYGFCSKATPLDFSVMKDSTFASDDGEDEKKDDFVEFRELRVFEKMEELTERPSFCSQASAVDRFLNHDISFEECQSEDEVEGCEDDVVSRSSQENSADEVDESVSEESDHESEDKNEKVEKTSDIKNQLSQKEYDDLVREMYTAVRQKEVEETPEDPDSLCSTVLERLNEQEIVMKDMKHELQLAKELRKALEYKETELQSERLKLESYKLEEKEKLEKQQKRVLMQRKSIDKVSEEASKLRDQNAQHLSKIETLTRKLSRIEMDLRKKSNLWESERKKLMERIEALEKLNAELHESQPHAIEESVPSKVPKRIHFSVDSTDSSKCTTSGKSNANQPTLGKAVGYKPRTSVIPPKSSMKKAVLKQIDNRPTETNNIVRGEQSVDSSDTVNFYDTAIVKRLQMTEEVVLSTDQELENDPSTNQSSKSCVIVNNLGDTETIYTNGCRKYVSKSRNFSRIIYQNGDIKEKRPDGSILYFFSDLGIRQYHYPNGLEMTSYPNGQMERKNPDGTHEILFPNGCVKFYRMDGREEYIFPDNTVYQVDPSNGNAILFLPNGQKEIHSSNWKKRIYPDGTTKTVFSDGTLETEYPNGRIRRKDSSGNLVFDLLSTTPTLQSDPQVTGKSISQLGS